MRISLLELSNFRNILSSKLRFNKNFNILFGNNGAGKTSLLEAIYFLSMGRSFRSQYQQALITHKHDKLTIFAQIIDDNNIEIPIGIERSIDGLGRLRVAEENVSTHMQITKLTPVQLIAAKDYRLIEGGPEFRRQLLDWGAFHVEHSFLSHWQKLHRAIKQRNVLLKNKFYSNHEQLEFWTKEIEHTGVILNQLRNNYIKLLKPLFNALAKQFLNEGISISLEYYAGWDADNLSLGEALSNNFDKDIRFGYTTSGPHRADIKLKIDTHLVQDILSRGQQKLLIYALRLAQGLLLKEQKQIDCVYLIDDLPSELDYEKSKEVMAMLSNMNNQTFITGIHPETFKAIDQKSCQTFHVKHGKIDEWLNNS
jgi:DNA replication and repair protein RecF